MRNADKEKYMEEALALAGKAEGRTYPNPMVGAVMIRRGRIIGKGYHKRFGGAHAETAAIKNAGGACGGATLFVTLEPCDHHGKTPPCTEAIIKSGIKKVYVAMKDPNPINRGRGIRRLRKSGIEVFVGTKRTAACELNRKYIKYIKHRMPYVTLKLAQTLDGRIAAPDGSSKWISGGSSRRLVKKMRASFDGIMVGSNTIRADDPLLLSSRDPSRGPARIIVDSALKISPRSRLIRTSAIAPVFIGTTEKASSRKIDKLGKIPGVHITVMKSRGGRVPLNSFLRSLSERGMMNILLEGGGELAGSLLDEGLIDEAVFFIAPKLLGGGVSSLKGKTARSIKDMRGFRTVEVSMSGKDVMITGVLSGRRNKCSPA
ncbi:MAG: bifunctional diaminohydroxyphosphoribosylaminopyrimidine deaminase/5-amino-6-(5-phosphoribosylamino)uracil reductase RibD [Candidatus Omnitrophota bacterium]